MCYHRFNSLSVPHRTPSPSHSPSALPCRRCNGDLIGNHSDVLCVTASNPDESSWGTYCPPNDSVNGTSIGSCLGDLFSVDWMQDSDGKRAMHESLLEQFTTVRQTTNLSHVQKYGDMGFLHWKIGVFQVRAYRKLHLVSARVSLRAALVHPPCFLTPHYRGPR